MIRVVKQLLCSPFSAAALTVAALFFATAVGVELYDAACRINETTPFYAKTVGKPFSPPSAAAWMGTDYQGRDVFFRAVAGISTAVKVGVVAGVISIVIGVTFGVVAGFFGGTFDDIVVWVYSTFASMPTLLFILAFALLVSRNFLPPRALDALRTLGNAVNAEPGMLAVYLAIGGTCWVTLCRVVRAETMKLRRAPFVEAARVAGVPVVTILKRHIIPNLFHLVIVYFTLNFAGAVMLEVIVSYLGIGAQSAPSWGVMISDGQERLWRGVWWEIAAAGGLMFFLVLSLNILGDALRDALDPKFAGRQG